METDTRQRLNSYVALFELISGKVNNDAATVAILQEMARDRRAQQMRAEREARNIHPATERQKSFMKKLGIQFPATVTKKEASVVIDEGLARNAELMRKGQVSTCPAAALRQERNEDVGRGSYVQGVGEEDKTSVGETTRRHGVDQGSPVKAIKGASR